MVGGHSVRCDRLLLCPGGMSYPRTGTSGEGYGWLAGLGLEVREPVPALVPLSSPAPWVRALAGVAWQHGEVRLTRGDRVLARRRRPLLFTHRGVSGPGPMDLSVHVARALASGWAGGGSAGGRGDFELRLDLCPERSREELRALLVDAARRKGAPRLARVLAPLLPAALPTRLLQAVAAAAGLAATNPALGQVARAERHRLVETLKGLAIPIDDTLGFGCAEVTAGGLALGEVDPATMEVNRLPGLHVFGELLDLDGPIGGLNFQAAFACAELAGRAATTSPER